MYRIHPQLDRSPRSLNCLSFSRFFLDPSEYHKLRRLKTIIPVWGYNDRGIYWRPQMPIDAVFLFYFGRHIFQISDHIYWLRLVALNGVYQVIFYRKYKGNPLEIVLQKSIKRCGGRDLNPRTPTRLDPESSAFDQARQPPLCFVIINIILTYLQDQLCYQPYRLNLASIC